MSAEYYDLVIRWDDKKSGLKQLMVNGSISVYGEPQHLHSGKWVALVSKSNDVYVIFKASAIEGPRQVKLAGNKNTKTGYRIKANKETIRQSAASEYPPLTNYLPVNGSLGYFDFGTWEEVIVGEPSNAPKKSIKTRTTKESDKIFITHTKGIPGLPLNNPEAILVEQYVFWIGEKARFGHNYIRVDNLYVDLFDLTHWQLIEAKSDSNREKIRMAIGQLKDYKRYYQRPPTLAVLLPSRPTDSCIALLTDNHISVIWKTPKESFVMKRWQG